LLAGHVSIAGEPNDEPFGSNLGDFHDPSARSTCLPNNVGNCRLGRGTACRHGAIDPRHFWRDDAGRRLDGQVRRFRCRGGNCWTNGCGWWRRNCRSANGYRSLQRRARSIDGHFRLVGRNSEACGDRLPVGFRKRGRQSGPVGRNYQRFFSVHRSQDGAALTRNRIWNHAGYRCAGL
jgi:hypothetical protein